MDNISPPLTAAIGDVHGRYDLLDPLLDHLEHLGIIAGGIRIVLLGDYVDRGRFSRQVINRLIAGPKYSSNEFVCIGGNHDEMMVRSLLEPCAAVYGKWFSHGGTNTLTSYGLEDDADLFNGRFVDFVPPEHVTFLRHLPPYFADETRIFVHAGLMMDLPLQYQDEEVVKNIRGRFLTEDHDFGKLVIHGHTIEDEPDIRPFRLGIDTGCYRSNILTSAVFEGTSTEPTFYQAKRNGFVGDITVESFIPAAAMAPSP